MEFGFFGPDSASLRMSKDTSASDSEKSLESWNQSVTRRRGEYSRRVKSGRPTSGSGFLSSAWPTVRASEFKDVGPVGSKSHDHMLGKGYLCAVVTQDAWQTPTTNMDMVRSEEGIQKRIEFRASIGRKSIPDGNLGEQMQRVIKHGHPAPANPSTDGSRQGLWTTITAHTPDMESSGPNGNSGTYLAGAVKQWATPIMGDSHLASTPEVAEKRLEEGKVTLSRQTAAWATPNAFCYQPPENTEQWKKRAEYQQSKGVNLHKPIQSQVLHEVEKQWGTPTARDHKSGRGNEEREYKELTPMVERAQAGKLNSQWVTQLMGLNLGWVSPSCPASVIKNWQKFVSGWLKVTIELTNSASSETESCLPQQNELFESSSTKF